MNKISDAVTTKKPIHLRLGAATNSSSKSSGSNASTVWNSKNKKSWRFEKVFLNMIRTLKYFI